jgi:hypothetical protein
MIQLVQIDSWIGGKESSIGFFFLVESLYVHGSDITKLKKLHGESRPTRYWGSCMPAVQQHTGLTFLHGQIGN